MLAVVRQLFGRRRRPASCSFCKFSSLRFSACWCYFCDTRARKKKRNHILRATRKSCCEQQIWLVFCCVSLFVFLLMQQLCLLSLSLSQHMGVSRLSCAFVKKYKNNNSKKNQQSVLRSLAFSLSLVFVFILSWDQICVKEILASLAFFFLLLSLSLLMTVDYCLFLIIIMYFFLALNNIQTRNILCV